jgi:hypothetical protein
LKCNVDASFSRTRNKEGIGVCIRDDCHTLNFAHSFFIGSFIINANLLFCTCWQGKNPYLIYKIY